MCLIFMGQGYPRKLFNLEHFPIYCIIYKSSYIVYVASNEVIVMYDIRISINNMFAFI